MSLFNVFHQIGKLQVLLLDFGKVRIRKLFFGVEFRGIGRTEAWEKVEVGWTCASLSLVEFFCSDSGEFTF
jgi:hypothetical protein